MEEAKRLSIHVVVCNQQAHLSDLASSLFAEDHKDFQAVIVDNASSDGAEAWLKERYPEALVLRNFKNQGFARAHNQAIALALSRWPETVLAERYIALVRPDMLFAPETFQRIIAVMDADPALMLAGPKVLRANAALGDDGETREIVATDIIESVGLSIRRTRHFFERGKGEKDQGQFAVQEEVFGPPSGCVVFRASAFRVLAIGQEWLDPDLPESQVIPDLLWRARVLGMRAFFIPDALAWRQGHAEPSSWYAWYRRASLPEKAGRHDRLLLITKNDHVLNVFLHTPWMFVDALRTVLIALADPRLLLFFLQSWLKWPTALKKRWKLRQQKVASAKSIRRWFV